MSDENFTVWFAGRWAKMCEENDNSCGLRSGNHHRLLTKPFAGARVSCVFQIIPYPVPFSTRVTLTETLPFVIAVRTKQSRTDRWDMHSLRLLRRSRARPVCSSQSQSGWNFFLPMPRCRKRPACGPCSDNHQYLTDKTLSVLFPLQFPKFVYTATAVKNEVTNRCNPK